MLKNILDLLKLQKGYGSTESIAIAKGVNKIPETTKELKQYFKRLANGNN
jgi:hypothetical protein